MSRALPLLPLCLLLPGLGCGNYSNALFEDDILYAESLPSLPLLALEDRMELDPQTPAARLLSLSLDTAEGLDLLIVLANSLTARAVVRPPTSRTEDSRTWGPYQLDDGSDASISVTRHGDSTWSWEGTRTPAGGASTGVFYAGWVAYADPVGNGDETIGGFELDLGVLSTLAEDLLGGTGQVVGGYTLRPDDEDGYRALDLVLDGVYQPDLIDQVYSGTYAYAEAPDTERFLEATFDRAGNDDQAALTYEVVTRWAPDGGGRADALTTPAGDQPLQTAPSIWIECWNAQGTEIYSRSDQEDMERGDEGLCPYESARPTDSNPGDIPPSKVP